MSGLYLLALIGVWLLVGWVIYRSWRRWQPQEAKRKVFHLVAGLLLFSLWFGGAFWEVAGKKMYWDAQVRKLCAIDGGVKVYETVKLTPEIYEYYAGRNWVLPDKSDAKSSDEYFYEDDIIYYHRKDPQVTRSLTRVIRRSDGKVLGEYIRYGRGGGDLPGPWHGSSFSCSDITRSPSFEKSIFTKGGK
ncbi:hypothetical protein [Desulfuromonas thiophila]|uniref:Uncharacterized protein n=1 Tax=Desulfuromonas thiophila TaxID=57664 RepID=A0A1G7DQ75_9BACT|nr:hypothetical protein [Desulfuromonas thiophila]SDE53674.1 hypothetical protein SAMN05661003_1158 [Desulfuromonas thiophila]